MSRPLDRARHIRDTIEAIRRGVGRRTLAELMSSQLDWAGFKYLLLTISEAAKHIPADWRAEHAAEINWKKVIGLGSVLRHDYEHLNAEALWLNYTRDLAPLEAAIDRMIAAHGSDAP